VIARPHDEFGCTLQAVIVARAGAALERAALAAFCAAELPAYMVPAEFELREALPRTSSGKVDRVALAK
jgi:feruloyl-CoA synthase